MTVWMIGDKIKCNRKKDREMVAFQWWNRHKEDIMTVSRIEEDSGRGSMTMHVHENDFGWNTTWMIKVDDEYFEKGEFEL